MELFDTALWHSQRLAATVLKAAVSQQRLSHAYLLSGRALDDKWRLARELACYLNCRLEDKEKHGSCILRFHMDSLKFCQNCSWIVANQHPQAFLQLSGGQTKSGKIPVENARELSFELTKTSEYFRVVVIPDAREEILHRPAANALLKTIEEPPKNTLFILFADHWQEVLPTIVSRCQVVTLMNSKATEEQLNPELKAKLDELISSAQSNRKTKRVLDGVKWAKLAHSLAEEEVAPAIVIDQIVAAEFSELKGMASEDRHVRSYLKGLLDLSDKTKTQLDHYVSAKSAFEYFALCLRRLRQGKLPEARQER